MKPKFDDVLGTLIAVLHYTHDRYDPEWPDLYSMVVADSMLRAFEVLGLASRTKDEDGQTAWHATEELKRLAARLAAKTANESGQGEAG